MIEDVKMQEYRLITLTYILLEEGFVGFLKASLPVTQSFFVSSCTMATRLLGAARRCRATRPTPRAGEAGTHRWSQRTDDLSG